MWERPQVLLLDKEKKKESRLSLQRFPSVWLPGICSRRWAQASEVLVIFLTFFSTPKLVCVLALSIYLWLIVRSNGEKPGKIFSPSFR